MNKDAKGKSSENHPQYIPRTAHGRNLQKEENAPIKYARAQKFSKLIKKGRHDHVKFQAYRKTPNFKRSTKTLLRLPRNPQFARHAVRRQNTWDRYSILVSPCTSERFYKKMENENTIIFYVAQQASKNSIKKAFKEAFGVVPEKVNTMNTILGRKKAFIKIPKTNEASEIANKIGLI